MIATSAAYKERVDADVREVHARVQIDYSDAQIDQSIVDSANGEGAQSIIEQVSNGIEHPTKRWWSWGAFEYGNTWIPDQTVEVGYHSAVVSRSDKTFLEGGPGALYGRRIYGRQIYGRFQNYPTVTVGFSERAITSLKAVFDSKLLEWAEEFEIRVWDTDNVLQHTEVVTGNTGVKYEVEITPIFNASRQELMVKKWSRAGTNAKVLEFLTSIYEVYEGDEIFSLSVLEESEVDDPTLPIGNVSANSCQVVLHNEDDKFNYGNADSKLNNQIKENRRISIWLRVFGAPDWIAMGVFYAKSWSIPEQDLSVTVSGQDVLSLMDQTTYETSAIITAQPDQSDSDTALSTWTLDNVVASGGVFTLGNAAVGDQVGGTPYGRPIYGRSVYGASGTRGAAERVFQFSYTAGLTAKVTADYDADEPANSDVLVEISFDQGTTWQAISDGGTVAGVFDTNADGTQDLHVRVTLVDRGAAPSFSGISLTFAQEPSCYSVAVAVCKDYGLLVSEYSIDFELTDYTIDWVYLDPMSHRAALKLIAQAAISRCYVDRRGVLRMEHAVSLPGTTVKTLTRDDYYEKNSPAHQGKVTNEVVVTTTPRAPAAAAEEVGKVTETVPAGGQLSVTIQYRSKPVTEGAIDTGQLAAGIGVVSIEYYTWGADVTVDNSNGTDTETDIVITGKPLEEQTGKRFRSRNEASIREFGLIRHEIQDNQLIQRDDTAQLICDRMVGYFAVSRRDLGVGWPGDPAMEVSDRIAAGGDYRVIRQEFEYDGALEVKTSGRIA